MKPKKKITAKNMGELYEEARGLPKEPVGDGECQLIQKRIGGRVLPTCAGKCGKGACHMRISITGTTITIECRCQ